MSDKIYINGNEFNVLVAVTENEQRKGLMHRSWPPPIMIFPYNRAWPRKFWMKNTPSPLDIIFCNNKKIVGIYNGEPLSLENVGPNEPTDLVIEMPKGYASKYGIVEGDEVEIKYSLQTLARKCNWY